MQKKGAGLEIETLKKEGKKPKKRKPQEKAVPRNPTKNKKRHLQKKGGGRGQILD